MRYGRVYREGKKAWTLRHQAWLRRQRHDEPLAQSAFEHMLCHLDAIDAQIAAVDRQLDEIARTPPWCDPVRWLTCFRGISTLTALGLLAEIGGLTVSEYSSGERRRRGSTTKTGNRHARRLLVEAAWHYQHPPRLSARIRAHDGLVPPEALARAWQAQTRLHQRHRHLTGSGKLPNIATVAVARELCGFLWAAMTRQPLQEQPKEVIRAA